MIVFFKKYLIIFIIFSIPFVLFISIFIFIDRQHKKSPDKLSCSSFRYIIQKTILLPEFRNHFDQDIEKICSCFKVKNPSGDKLQFVTEHSLAICAKPYINKWIDPFIYKEWNEYYQECVRNNIYNELTILIVNKQKRGHSSQLFTNDLFKYNLDKLNLDTIYKNCSQFKL